MAYLGNTPTTQNFISGTDYFNGTGSQTVFTLTRSVASINDIQVTVNNVVQQPNDAYTLSGTTLTMTSAPSAGTNNVYVRYLSTTTQSITPSQNTVSWNTLDTNTQQDLGVMGKNRIINGNMVIDQRNAGAAVTASTGTYTLDRWRAYSSQASKFTVQQNAGSVTPPVGFTNYLGVTSSSAYSSGASDLFILQQLIEGFNTADLNFGTANAKSVTLSFWVYSSLTGTFSGSVMNSAANRSYPYAYTISAANTWEYKTITVAGDTTGTWVGATNGLGIRLNWNLGSGSSNLGTAGAWAGSEVYGSTGSVSVVGTSGATFYLTGVQLEVGTQATTFTTAGGSYGAELALCQRYCYVLGGSAVYESVGYGVAIGSTVVQVLAWTPVEMRVVPSSTQIGTWQVSNASAGFSGSALGIQSGLSGKQSIALGITTSGVTGGALYRIEAANSTASKLILSSEL
jgi:hypothetical protein